MISDGVLDVRVGQQVPFHFALQDNVSISFEDKLMSIKDSSGNETVKLGITPSGQLAFQAYDPDTGTWAPSQSLTPTQNSDNSVRVPHDDSYVNYIQIDGSGFKIYLSNTLIAQLDTSGLTLSNLPITGLQSSNNLSSAINRQTFEDARYDLKTNPTTQVAQVLNLLGSPVVVFGVDTVSSQLKLTYAQRPASFTSQDIPDTQYVNDEIDTCQPLSEKGQINGYAPLDAFGYVPATHLPILQLNQTYVGNDADKTNPTSYPSVLPIRGTLYIATDTQSSYILAGEDYTVSSNWVQLAPTLSVLSINGMTGTVSITSDDVPEGSSNLYFASGMSNYLASYANTIGNLLKLNNSGLIQSQFYGERLVLNNGAIAIRDDQSSMLHFENALTNTPIIRIQQSAVYSDVSIEYSTRPLFTGNQQLIDKQYVDDAISIFATDRIHDSTNQSKVICADPTTIQLITDNQITAQITNQGENASISSKGLYLNTTGDNSTDNVIQINGNRAENIVANKTQLNIVQTEYAGRKCNSELNMSLSGSLGAALQLQSGVDPSAPAGSQNYINIQSPSNNTDLVSISSGLPSVDNTVNIIADKNAPSNILQTQFNRKTGYSNTISITEPQQFASKQYTDTKMSIDYSLSDISTRNITLGDINMNSNRINNITDPTLAQSAATKNYVDTRSVNTLSNQIADYSTQGYKITNLANATLATDALNRQTADSRYYLNTTTLDSITAPIASVNLNNQKIINLAEPTANSDSTTKNYVDTGLATKYANTTTLDNITLAAASVNLNSNKIINLADATLATDALNRQTADSRYYLNTTTLNDITAAIAPVGLNNQKIINLSDPTQAQDAATKNYTDIGLSGKYANSTTLNNITLADGSVDLNINKIINLADATLATDALNRQTADSRYYLNTTTLNGIIVPTASVNLNNQKIINLADPTLSSDSTTKFYVDTGLNTKYANTTTLDNITLAASSVSLNNNKIINLADATLATDALNRQYADSRYYLNTTTLDSITAPTGNISANNNKIINISDPTLGQDAATKTYADTKYANTTTLDSITAPAASLSLNNHKIINLADATLATDALNRQTADGRYYLNTTTLDSITAPATSVSLNNHKIMDLAEPTLSADSTTKNYVDTGLNTKYANTTTLDNIAAATSSVNFNSNKIINLADATLATDALNRQTADSRYYINTTTLDSIAAPIASVSLNSNKIINLADPTLTTDAATKAYADTKYVNTTTLDSITAAASDVNLNSHKITNLANATLATDALNRQTADGRYYLNTTTLNNITAPVNSIDLNNHKIINMAEPTLGGDSTTKNYVDTGLGGKYANTTTLDNITLAASSVSLNNNKITNLADATLATDALNRQTADSRYYLNTTTLDSITAPITSVSLNSHKIVNLADPTLAQDASTKTYTDTGLATKYANTTTLDNITLAATSVNLNSNKIINLADPTLAQDAATKSYVDTATSSASQSINQIATSQPTAADWSNSGYKITNVSDPSSAQDVATKFYVDSSTSVGNASQIANATISTSKLVANQTELTNGSTPLNMNSQQIIGIANGTASSDAVNKSQLDGKYDNTLTLEAIQTTNPITSNLNLNAYTVQTSKSSGFASNELIPKTYADSTYGVASFPVGAIVAWHSNSIPTNWLLCNGQTFSAATYPDLAVVLGSTAVPDLRGYFLRGLDTRTTGNVDPDSSTRIIGSVQTSTNLSHIHTYQDVGFYNNSGSAPVQVNVSGSGNTDSDNEPLFRKTDNTLTADYNDPSTLLSTGATGSVEARPINKAVNYIIRAAASSSYITGVYPSLGNIDLLATYKVTNSINPTILSDLINVSYLKSLIGSQQYVQLICVNSFPAINNYIGDSNWTNKQMATGDAISYNGDGTIWLKSNQVYEVMVSFTSSNSTVAQVILYDTFSGIKLCTQYLGIDTTSSAALDPWWVEVRNNQSSGWVGTGTSVIISTGSTASFLGARVVGGVPGNASTYTLKVKVLNGYYIDQSAINS